MQAGVVLVQVKRDTTSTQDDEIVKQAVATMVTSLSKQGACSGLIERSKQRNEPVANSLRLAVSDTLVVLSAGLTERESHFPEAITPAIERDAQSFSEERNENAGPISRYRSQGGGESIMVGSADSKSPT
jgi:hypothetical protein